MNRRRVLLTCAVLALAVAAPQSAGAAPRPPKPVCNLLVDGKGDGVSTIVPVVKSDTLDLLGGDVATGKKTLVVTLRVASTDGSNDTWAKLGYVVSLQFTIRGKSYRVERERKLGPEEIYEHTSSTSGLIRTDVTPNSITWVIDRNAVPELSKANTLITGLSASSFTFFSNGDAATSPKTYADRYPSCLKPA